MVRGYMSQHVRAGSWACACSTFHWLLQLLWLPGRVCALSSRMKGPASEGHPHQVRDNKNRHSFPFILKNSSLCPWAPISPSSQLYPILPLLTAWPVNFCTLSHFSHVQFFVTLWTRAHQGPLSTGVGGRALLQGSSPPRDWPRLSRVSCVGMWVLYR